MTTCHATPAGDRIVEPMIALACCTKQHQIVVAGSRAVEFMRGFAIEAGTVHECGCAVSARRREMNSLRKAA